MITALYVIGFLFVIGFVRGVIEAFQSKAEPDRDRNGDRSAAKESVDRSTPDPTDVDDRSISRSQHGSREDRRRHFALEEEAAMRHAQDQEASSLDHRALDQFLD